MLRANVKLRQSASAQRIHRHGHHLQISLVPHRTDHFHPALGNLTTAARMGLSVTEHGLVVIQPLGQRVC